MTPTPYKWSTHPLCFRSTLNFSIKHFSNQLLIYLHEIPQGQYHTHPVKCSLLYSQHLALCPHIVGMHVHASTHTAEWSVTSWELSLGFYNLCSDSPRLSEWYFVSGKPLSMKNILVSKKQQQFGAMVCRKYQNGNVIISCRTVASWQKHAVPGPTATSSHRLTFFSEGPKPQLINNTTDHIEQNTTALWYVLYWKHN